jgi:hypothetical protein
MKQNEQIDGKEWTNYKIKNEQTIGRMKSLGMVHTKKVTSKKLNNEVTKKINKTASKSIQQSSNTKEVLNYPLQYQFFGFNNLQLDPSWYFK